MKKAAAPYRFGFFIGAIVGLFASSVAGQTVPTGPTGQTEIPPVALSEGHASTCKVKVGDNFPLTELVDLQGEKVRMKDVCGKNLTVILVFSEQLAYGKMAYQQLGRVFVRPFAEKGLAGIAVNRGDALEEVSKSAEKYGEGVVTLRDPADTMWKQIATTKMPRVYLLDANGRIIWMDVEFSLGTARDLRRAILASTEDTAE